MNEKEAKKNHTTRENHAGAPQHGAAGKPAEKPAEKSAEKPAEKPAEIVSPEVVVPVLKAEYETLTAKAAERDAFHDKYMRAHAEFENARKRLEKDKADFARYATDGLIAEFLPMFDNVELAEKYIKEAKDFKAVREGVDMIQVQIQKLLKDIGVERVKTVGEKFDPHAHEALEVEETEDQAKEDGLIIAELKPGYRFNGRLLRPASVKIIKRKP